MSWIVQSLWNNRERIKTKSHPTIRDDDRKLNTYKNRDLIYILNSDESPDEYVVESEPSYDDPFIESDSFNDLLVIEKAVNELKELNLLNQDDLDILYNTENVDRTRNQKYAFDKKFSYICERVAYYLGGYFTDEGYINYLARKYKLTEDQIEILKGYMRSQFKNKTLRKGYRIETNHEKTRTVPTEV